MRNPCSARLIGSRLLSDFHTPITRNPQTTWAEAEPVNLRRVSPPGQSLACGSGKAVRCSSCCRWTRDASQAPAASTPFHRWSDGAESALNTFYMLEAYRQYTGCLILSAHLSPSSCSAHVCKHLAGHLAESLTWRCRWNLSQISWICFIHPKSP